MFRYFTLASVVLVLALPAFAAEPLPKKVAVLVGVDEYDKSQLGNFQFAGRDAVVLGIELENFGFTTTVLTTDMIAERQPTKKNILAALKKASDGLTKQDVILFHFSGQGFQLNGSDEAYLCPRDGIPDDAKSMIAVSELLTIFERAGAGNSFLLLDACRTDPDPTRGRGIDRSLLTVGSGLGVLLACTKNEKCYETPEAKHGLFTYAILKGLRGEAKDHSGKVTWDSLAAYVRETVPVVAEKMMNGRKQRPQLIANLVGPSFVFVPSESPKSR